jgi:hypothetical protein
MPARTELDRLAAARPPILDHTEWILDPAVENAILRQILGTTQVATGRRPAGRRRSRRPLIGLAAAAAVIAVAGGGALVRSATAHSPAPLRLGSGHRLAGTSALPPDKVTAARAAKAVDAASRRDILYVTTNYAAGTTVGGIAVMQTWSKGISNREKLIGTGGALREDESAVISHGRRVRRFVDYTSRTWQTDSIALGQYGSGGPPGQTVGELLAPHLRPRVHLRLRGSGRPDFPSRTIKAVTVHGMRMILVTISYPRLSADNAGDFAPLLDSGEMLPGAAAGHSFRVEEIWINATTYLPIRAELIGPGGSVLVAETLTWLSANPANRAEFSPAPVPAGFRRTAELAH